VEIPTGEETESMLTAGIVSIDSKSSAALHASLRQTGLVSSVVEWVAPSRGAWQLSSSETVPDVVMLDLSMDPGAYFAFATELRRLRPTVRLIACSSLPSLDSELLLQAMRTGVQDFISRPISHAELEETLNRFVQELGDGEPVGRDRVFIVQGSKGGVGASTVAVNLAVQLAKVTQKRVGLLDLGFPLGMACLMLDLRPAFTVCDAIENLERLDSHFISGLLIRHKTGVEVLAGTSHAEEWSRLDPSAVVRLVNVAQSVFDFLVIDFGRMYSAEWKPVLAIARAILMVAQADVPSLWALDRHMNDLLAMGLDPERLRVVINRWHRTDNEALERFEKSSKNSIFARLPNDYEQASAATNVGVPLSKNHGDPLTTEYRQLATHLAGTIPAGGEKRSGLFGLFGRKG
jgi:pilus assembly protein CpaE